MRAIIFAALLFAPTCAAAQDASILSLPKDQQATILRMFVKVARAPIGQPFYESARLFMVNDSEYVLNNVSVRCHFGMRRTDFHRDLILRLRLPAKFGLELETTPIYDVPRYAILLGCDFLSADVISYR